MNCCFSFFGRKPQRKSTNSIFIVKLDWHLLLTNWLLLNNTEALLSLSIGISQLLEWKKEVVLTKKRSKIASLFLILTRFS